MCSRSDKATLILVLGSASRGALMSAASGSWRGLALPWRAQRGSRPALLEGREVRVRLPQRGRGLPRMPEERGGGGQLAGLPQQMGWQARAVGETALGQCCGTK